MNKPKRQLSQKERRLQIKECIKSDPLLSNRSIARICGCAHGTVQKIRSEMEKAGLIDQSNIIKDAWRLHPYVIRNPRILEKLSEHGKRAIKAEGVLAMMEAKGLTSPVYAQRLIFKEAKAARNNLYVEIGEDACTLFVADIKQGLPQIDDCSVDLLLTDALYCRDGVPLFEDLGRVANRVLRDEGILLCMVGQSYLPEQISLLSEHLTYHWTLACITPNGSPFLYKKRLTTGWKPILMFVKSEYTGDMAYDIVRAPIEISEKEVPPHTQTIEVPEKLSDNPVSTVDDLVYAPADKAEKELLRHAQPLEVFETLIERFSRPGDCVLDVFCGSGTTAVAALKKKRKVIACDKEEKRVEMTRKRIEEEVGIDVKSI
jgi:site-specific DNA-methyltransferase (adenine-specific)